MRNLLVVTFCLAAIAVVVSADPEPQGSIVLQGSQPLSGPERRPTINLDYQHLWEGKNGHFSASGGGQQLPGGRFEPHVGLQGSWRFRRSADPEPQGSIVFQGSQPLSGHERRPTINLDYQHKIWEGKNGHFSASGGGQQLPGGRFEPHVGLQGSWRFRRSADPEPQGSIVFQGSQPLSGPERRPTINLDYQHMWEGKNGHFSASGGAQQLPGGRFEPHVGVQGTWRFRRSADPEPQGSIVFQGSQPLSGHERRPTINLDYQHKIWEGKNGHFSASGGGQQLPGGRFEPHVGLQGSWRFRRSADPEPQGSIVFQGSQPLSGPERRPTINLDYQHMWEGKNGHFSASGGGQQLPGGRFEPHVGVQGTWRFRRSADPEPQGSIVFQGSQPLSGHERRPTINLDYQHKIWEGKNGHFSASGGGQQLPGGRFEPHVGLQGSWRFRRSADPEPQGSIVFQGSQPLSGPERRPTINLDYQHLWEGKNGHFSASGGGQQLPGGRFEPHVGLQGTWRFRRSANPEPVEHKPQTGPPRTGTGSWRFRRSEEPEACGAC